MDSDIFSTIFGAAMRGEKYDKDTSSFTGKYKCVKCIQLVKTIWVQPVGENGTRKLFYCENNKCAHFGIITVVVKK